jgi:Fic family protein
MAGERQRLHERALLACGRLDGISHVLPEPDLFLYAYVRREAVLSSQIEGTQSSLSDLLVHEAQGAPGAPIDDVTEVSNYVAALTLGLERLKEGFPLCLRLLREMHARLLASGRGRAQMPGEFRRSQNWIGGTRPGNAAFVPPPPHAVPECMGALERFLHEDRSMGPLLRAAVAHVQFETIHPFLDGNGRLGRLLIALLLHHEGVLRQPLLYLSLYLKEHRARYYQLLDEVRRDGNWEAWVDFFLEGVEQTAAGAVTTAERLRILAHRDKDRLAGAGRGATMALRVHEQLLKRPVATIAGLAAACQVSFPTAARAVETLEQVGLVREVTGRARDRVYAYSEYLAILNEGTDRPV